MLRKLAHWSGDLAAGPVGATGTVLDYAALTPGPAAPDADEVVHVERARMPLDSPEVAYPSAARWSAIKRVPYASLVAPPSRVAVEVDAVTVEALAWHVPPHRLLVAVHGALRLEVWAPADLVVVVVPLAGSDTVSVSWSGGGCRRS